MGPGELAADRLTVGGEDGHHLARVLRLRSGETVTAADGEGTWRPFVADAVAGDVVVLAAAGPCAFEPEPAVRIAVAFALTKGDKPDLVIAKLTELGVTRVLPVAAARSVSRPTPERAEAALARWRRVAREASRQ
ncbi:MAG: RsmE family RNA methyltransferase, partial [Acidimicrobiia bacterium]